MTLILFIIFAIAIFGVMLLLTVIKGITSFLFGKSDAFSGYGDRAESQKNRPHDYAGRTYKKVFSKDEGEYVKYEEVKE